MQNEFEKQVREKMEELKLVPSDPVWQKVEEQIRKKREKRRFFFFILPTTVLLVATGWWLIATNSHSSPTTAERTGVSLPASVHASVTKNKKDKNKIGQ